MERLLERHGPQLDEAFEQAQTRLEAYTIADVELLTFFDERYPNRLRELSDPPPLIYVRGNLDLLTRDQLVAVVGTREPTVFGISAAERLTGVLADSGWGIVRAYAGGAGSV